MLLITLGCAWMAGTLIGYKLDLSPLLTLAGLAPLPLLLFMRRKGPVVLASLALFALFGAAAYSYSSLNRFDEHDLRFYNGAGAVEIRGMVAADPEIRDQVTHLQLSAEGLKAEGVWQDIDGTALLFVPRYPAYEYGDVLHIRGEPQAPPRFEEFDYKGYLAHRGIHTTIPYPEIEIVDRGKGFKPLEWIYALRNGMSRTLAAAMPEPQASLAQAILLGKRGMVPQPLRDDFARTGTAHLLAISGLHLAIIAGMVLVVVRRLLGKRHYLYVWLAMGAIWLYALLTGMHPPVVRGAIMASMFLVAELAGRQRSAITALVFAAAVMVGVSPYILGDAAFQLSFLAMAGLLFVFPTLQAWGRKAISAVTGEDGKAAALATMAGDSLAVTLSAIIAVWPVIAHYFGIVSFAGPLATFLLLPALPGVIVAATIAGLLGFLFPLVAQLAGWAAWLFLLYMVWVVEGLAATPFAFVETGPVSPAFILSYYLMLGAIIRLKYHRGSLGRLAPGVKLARAGAAGAAGFISRLPRKWAVPPLLVAALLVSFAAAAMPDDDLHVSFLDVGEGDAIFIQKGGRQVLVDGGPSPQAIALALGEHMPFWDRTIDLLVLTHPHQDHLAGLVEVLQRYRVDKVLYTGRDDSPLYRQWQRLIRAQGATRVEARAGQQVDLGDGASIRVLHPGLSRLKDTQSDVDNNSVVLRLGQGDIGFLLTADIMQEAERELIGRRAGVASTVLKVAHHGSDTSTTPEFIAAADPQLAVISCAADNRFGHPSPEVVARLAGAVNPHHIYRTDRHGTIEFATDGRLLWVEAERKGP